MNENTEQLIARLAAAPRRTHAAARRRFALLALVALLLSFALHLGLLGLRTDFLAQLANPDYLAKLGLLALAALLTVAGLWRAGLPGQKALPVLRWTLSAGLALLLGVALADLGAGLPGLNSRVLMCVPLIAVLGLPAVALLALALRDLAPTDLPRAATTLGLAAWALSALAYAFHCNADLMLGGALPQLGMLLLYALAAPLFVALAHGLLFRQRKTAGF